jgi:hypothetical protein
MNIERNGVKHLESQLTEPTILKTGLDLVNEKLTEVPEGKNGALITTVEWRSGVPVMRFGIAQRHGDNLKFGVEAENRFARNTLSAKAYVSWTW